MRGIASVVVLLLVAGHCAADAIYVDVDGPNDPGTGSYEDPFRRIQDAIDSADNNDTVIVAEGVYTGDPNNRDLHFDGKTITVRSTDPNDPNVVANTIIDPNGAGRGFYFFNSGEDPNCIVSGLTIRNGATGGKGGGIHCYKSSPTIMNCIISGHYAGTHGGGLFCQNSNSPIIGCTISGNISENDGGGIECWRSKAEVTNCVMFNNRANGMGGAVDYFDNDDVTITNCTFAGNSANSGGALYCWASNVTVNNGIFWANKAATGPQIALNVDSSSSVSIRYSDVQGGETAVYDPPAGLIWDSNSNMDADPCFASFDANGDPNIWDFHLQSVYGRCDSNSRNWVGDSNTSLCIDAGDPNSNWTDEPWPNGKRINMGAYGGTNQASMNGNPGDFDVDGSVDFADFAEFSSQWMAEEACIEDLTNNGVVDFNDLRIFTDNWLWQEE